MSLQLQSHYTKFKLSYKIAMLKQQFANSKEHKLFVEFEVFRIHYCLFQVLQQYVFV